MATRQDLGFAGIGDQLVSLKPKKKKPVPTLPTIKPTIQPVAQQPTPVVETPVQREITTPIRQMQETPEVIKEEPRERVIKSPVQEVQQGPSIEDLEARKRAIQLQNMKDAVNRAFEQTKGQIDVERQALIPRFREERSRIGVEDVMARTGAEKIQATQGLSGAGARTQSDIAQSVLTQGALGQSRARQSEREAELDRAMVEAAQARDLGIAQAEAGAEMAMLEGQISAEQARVAQELKQAEIADEREYQLYLRELDKADDREMLLLKNELERENALLDAEIAEARAVNDNARAIQLENIRSQNNIKLQGIRDANAMRRLEVGGEQNLREIAAREALSARADEEEPLFDDKTITSSVQNAINQARAAIERPESTDRFGRVTQPAIPFTFNDEREAVKQWIVQNADDLSADQGERLVRSYNLDRNELARILQGGVSPGGQ